MPKEWYDRHAANKVKDEEVRRFYRGIVADKKPYFMRYIYPSLMKQYNTYIKNTTKNALRKFQLTVDELYSIPESERTEEQSEFLRYYEYRMPVGMGDCVMNKICRRFEEKFDGYIGKRSCEVKFDYGFMKSSSEYSYLQYNEIRKLYEDYNKRLRGFMALASSERIDEISSLNELKFMNEQFQRACFEICPNSDTLCNIVLDICYLKNSTKRFAWSMCGSDIIHNLLLQNDNTLLFPVLDEDGEIEYGGNKFSVTSMKVEVNEWE